MAYYFSEQKVQIKVGFQIVAFIKFQGEKKNFIFVSSIGIKEKSENGFNRAKKL